MVDLEIKMDEGTHFHANYFLGCFVIMFFTRKYGEGGVNLWSLSAVDRVCSLSHIHAINV